MSIVGHSVENRVRPDVEASREGWNKVQGLIIEFVGLTGSGKTTNCQHFSGLLNKNGIKAYVFKDVKEFLYKMKPFQRMSMYGRILLYNSMNVLSYSLLMVANGIYGFDPIKRYIKLSIFNGAVQEFMKRREVDVLLLDQWIIQGLWSATIFKARSYVSLQKRLPDFYFPTAYVLFFDVDEETACTRIGARKSGRSRFDRMDYETRLVELKKYNLYLRRLYENSKCANKLNFSTKMSPAKNAEEFLDHLQITVHKEH